MAQAKSSTLAEYDQQIADLLAKRDEIVQEGVESAREQCNAIAKSAGFPTVRALFRNPASIKYQTDPTGETWTGRGRMPTWIAEHEDEHGEGSREVFAVAKQSDEAH